MPGEGEIARVESIESLIQVLRGQKVLIDADLARLYGVTNRRLNEQIKRNRGRFPPDFVFILTPDEKAEVVANCDHLAKLKFSKTLPKAFSEHGALMAANVLNSRRAVEVSIFIVRAFIKLRELAVTHQELAPKLAELERRVTGHDDAIRSLVAAIRQLTAPPPELPRGRIGFQPLEKTPAGK